ncbi:hypothetical protein DEU56DRAFT_355626 [Suillus clintonianus]|uniref:uncharacterized protein n=1 Tax=Suillus clintonianus TaxID=1904413 RepID=UPI001B87755D|nr:uncharacterized protein DEU56DRAFT_355626 [Suillus clintonianus]KAG2136631.1 hypothetical protein DEU56DRAFT_355626 [Suillus clintonianus]
MTVPPARCADVQVCLNLGLSTSAKLLQVGDIACCDPNLAVPLLRAYNHDADKKDHFYTTNAKEMKTAIDMLGYAAEAVAAYVFPTPQPATVPLYRMFNTGGVDHFYTTSFDEMQRSVLENGYNDEGIAAHVFKTNICGSIPLYRLWSVHDTDHLYTTSIKEVNTSVAKNGYVFEGIEAYVLPVR